MSQDFLDWLDGKPTKTLPEIRVELSQRVKVKCPDCYSPSWKHLPNGLKKCRSCGKEFGEIV